MHLLLLLSLLITDTPLTVVTTGSRAPGYFMVSGIDQDSACLIDNSGVAVHRIHAGPNINQRPTPYGGFTYFDGLLSAYVLVNSELRKTDTFRVTPPYKTDFHEGYQTRGRRYIVLGVDMRTMDMSQTIQGGSESAVVLGAVIQEFDRRGRLTFEWRSLDHIHPTEATHDIDLLHNRIDYIHANAIALDSAGDFLLSCRNLDQIIKISRSSGSIVWRLGGSSAVRNDFTFTNDTVSGYVGFSHQHTPILTKQGEILLFDNGNLKSDQRSRVVAYRLDQTLMTATKTWEYQPLEIVFSATMGSVQELSNGNILIGWGTTQNGLVATEVDRNGTVHTEIRSTQQLDFPYRVTKAPVGMTVVTKTMVDNLPQIFSDLDSTTKVVVHAQQLSRPQDITVERHPYPPHELMFIDSTPCEVFPERWVIGYDSHVGNIYSGYFDVSRSMAEEDPSAARVFWRPEEGTGVFRQLRSEPVEASATVRVKSLPPGEYALGSIYCENPSLLYPFNNEQSSATTTQLKWTGAIGAEGYEMELSTSPEFTTDVVFLRTQRPDTTIRFLQPTTTYYWHVRVIRPPEVGKWTQTWTFTTMTPSTVPLDGNVAELPVGTLVVVYDVLGNEIARETIVREHQPLASNVEDKLLLLVATTPSGATLRRVINR
jgi:hypothetical protein